MGDEALHLALGVADQALASLVIRGLGWTAKVRREQCDHRCEASCKTHLSLLSGGLSCPFQLGCRGAFCSGSSPLDRRRYQPFLNVTLVTAREVTALTAADNLAHQ